MHAHLGDYPTGKRRLDVIYLRGANRFREGRFADARADLEAFLEGAPEGRLRDAHGVLGDLL